MVDRLWSIVAASVNRLWWSKEHAESGSRLRVDPGFGRLVAIQPLQNAVVVLSADFMRQWHAEPPVSPTLQERGWIV